MPFLKKIDKNKKKKDKNEKNKSIPIIHVFYGQNKITTIITA